MVSCHPMPGGVHSPLLCHVTRTPALRCGGVHVWFLEGPQPSSVLGTGPRRPHLWVGTPQSACLMECPGAPSRAGHCQGLSNERQLSFRWAVDGGCEQGPPMCWGVAQGSFATEAWGLLWASPGVAAASAGLAQHAQWPPCSGAAWRVGGATLCSLGVCV